MRKVRKLAVEVIESGDNVRACGVVRVSRPNAPASHARPPNPRAHATNWFCCDANRCRQPFGKFSSTRGIASAHYPPHCCLGRHWPNGRPNKTPLRTHVPKTKESPTYERTSNHLGGGRFPLVPRPPSIARCRNTPADTCHPSRDVHSAAPARSHKCCKRMERCTRRLQSHDRRRNHTPMAALTRATMAMLALAISHTRVFMARKIHRFPSARTQWD